MLPNLVIIGAMKCGTTSLHYYLGAHPQIRMSREKELNFFVRRPDREPRSLDWYRAQFRGDAPIHGEASPAYSAEPWCGGVPERMHATIPDARLVYLVRDPIERLISHWIHMVAAGRDNRGFDEVLEDLDNDYVRTSRYHYQLERFLRYYDRSQVLILSQEDLWRKRSETLREVFCFLGVSPDFVSRRFDVVKHETRAKRRKTKLGYAVPWIFRRLWWPVPTNVKHALENALVYPLSLPIVRPHVTGEQLRRLHDVLGPDVEKLRVLAARSFDEWETWNGRRFPIAGPGPSS